MSADNGIYILHTKDNFMEIEDGGMQRNMFDEKVDCYRVAHTQGADNFSWYEDNQIYMLGLWMHEVFGRSKAIYSKEEALEVANHMSQDYTILEYGICVIDATKYSFN